MTTTAPGECPSTAHASLPEHAHGLLRRYALALVGLLFVAIGWIGAFVPGIPTVGPLLAASYCFTRSCPWLEQRLIRNRFFARFLVYLDGKQEMPLRARYAAIGMMWASIVVSVICLILAGRRSPLLLGAIIAAGFVGTAAIWLFRRNVPATLPSDAPSAPSGREVPDVINVASAQRAAPRAAQRGCPAGFVSPAFPANTAVSSVASASAPSAVFAPSATVSQVTDPSATESAPGKPAAHSSDADCPERS